LIEVTLSESDRIEYALKAFRRKVQRSGILKEVKAKRHYLKPSLARKVKIAAARRRARRAARKR
jgi:small subunit ribosomal protein S21